MLVLVRMMILQEFLYIPYIYFCQLDSTMYIYFFLRPLSFFPDSGYKSFPHFHDLRNMIIDSHKDCQMKN